MAVVNQGLPTAFKSKNCVGLAVFVVGLFFKRWNVENDGKGSNESVMSHACIMPFLQPLLYNYVGTSTRDEDRDKDHKLDHDF